MESKDRAIRFIGHFLKWYQESFGQSDVYNHIKLVDLVKEAEDIHVQRIKERDQEYRKNVITDCNDRPTKILKRQVKKMAKKHKRISRYL